MTLRLFQLIPACCTALLTGCAIAQPCNLQQLNIQPEGAENSAVYAGKTDKLEVRFVNEKISGIVDSFPEPPMTIMRKDMNSSCQVTTGIWSRNDLYLSQDATVLITHEYSGSNDTLVFYNTKNCATLAQIDISGKSWNIQPSTIEITDIKKNQHIRYQLDNACIPHKK